ncbi:putative Leucine Rich repeat [Trypanosoma vivax]|nr:hypothetical protein TRVL_07950 [Trypanosoma vivax]KAH8616613.1 putative Leucine Rich repeat [Trypanosoma vivax]
MADVSSPVEVYREQCKALGLVANSGLLRTLPQSGEDLNRMGVLHFGRNFLGDRGVVPLLAVLKKAASMHTLNLSNNGISNDGIKALCRAMREHPSLRVLDVSGNPFTYLAGRELARLCEENSVITTIHMGGTLMTEKLHESVIIRIQETMRRRRQRELRGELQPHDTQESEGADKAAIGVDDGSLPPAADGTQEDAQEVNQEMQVDEGKIQEEDAARVQCEGGAVGAETTTVPLNESDAKAGEPLDLDKMLFEWSITEDSKGTGAADCAAAGAAQTAPVKEERKVEKLPFEWDADECSPSPKEQTGGAGRRASTSFTALVSERDTSHLKLGDGPVPDSAAPASAENPIFLLSSTFD